MAQCPHSAPPSAPRAQLPICFTCAKQGSSTLTFYGCFEGKAQLGKTPRICQYLFIRLLPKEVVFFF